MIKLEEEKKEEIKKEEKKEEEKKKENKNESQIVKNLISSISSQNNYIIQNLSHSLETKDKLRMSELKFPISSEDLNLISQNTKKVNEQKQTLINYPISAIGLLKSDFGKGYFLYGTATLIGPDIILTCAHNVYSPVLKKKAEYITFYMDLTNGHFLKESQIETFIYPDEYEFEKKENYDYAICLLKDNIGVDGGYLGICPFDKENNKKGFFYGYVNSRIDNYYDSFRCKLEDYNIKGCNMELSYDSKEQFLLYLNEHTFNGQDGSPIFKKKENDISQYPLPINDFQIFALDCSFTKMQLLYINKNKFRNTYITNDKILYNRTNRAIPITNSVYTQILRWIHFYTVVKPKGLENSMKMSYTNFRTEGKDILLKTNISNPSSVAEFSNTVRTNMNQLINKINQDIHNYDENVLTLKKRDFKIKRRFPVNEKSEDTRYKEAIDYTVDHLHLISPKIKYQINNRYSNILGRRDYDKMISYMPHYHTEIPYVPERIEDNEKIENEKEEVLE